MHREELFDSRGQDLIEYSLILALVCLLGAAALMSVGQDVSAIWSIVNSRLFEAASSGS
ncbi:MAG: Flp family type IVb pilin [Bryobacteraceae bacterium]